MKQHTTKKRQQNAEPTTSTELRESIIKFSDSIDGFVYPLISLPSQAVNEDILFEVYSDLKRIKKQEKMHILLHSYGGDAHTAFQIGRLFQKFSTELYIYILRKAKSAATLLACAADKIIFSDLSELGPMDPQISRRDAGGRFSPLAIKHIFDLLHQQSEEGHEEIVKVLTDKLPDPLILGELLKSLETGKDYLDKLLSHRMFKNDLSPTINGQHKSTVEIAENLVTGYSDHGYCIDLEEAEIIGLNVERIRNKKDENMIFNIIKSYKDFLDKFDFQMTETINKAKDSEPLKPEDIQKIIEFHEELKKLTTEVIKHQLAKK